MHTFNYISVALFIPFGVYSLVYFIKSWPEIIVSICGKIPEKFIFRNTIAKLLLCFLIFYTLVLIYIIVQGIKQFMYIDFQAFIDSIFKKK